MKKSDIKNGMHVITNNGNEYVIIDNVKVYKQMFEANTIMVRIDKDGWLSLDSYNDDFNHDSDRDFNINTIYIPKYYKDVLSSVYDNINFIKVWERPFVKKMTKADIEAKLGYEIEIVD